MKARRFLATRLMIATMLLAAGITAQTQPNSQTTAPLSAEDAQIVRLVGLAKVWGAVKYFHPFLAYQKIDWDQALIESIPKVKSAQTPNEYQTAINQMLAMLDDQGTRAEIETGITAASQNQTIAAAKEPVRTENGVLLIDLAQIFIIIYQGSPNAYDSLTERISQNFPAAKAVVIDGRWEEQTDPDAFYLLGYLLRQILPQMLNENVTLGSTRYRMHNGYVSQIDAGFDFCYSAFVNVAPQIMTGQNKTKPPPIVFIINHNTPPVDDILSGLQSANCIVVIQEGEQSNETDNRAFTLELLDNVKVRIRTCEPVNPDGSIGFRADKVVQKSAKGDAAMREAMRFARQKNSGRTRRKASPDIRPLLSLKEKTYPEMEFPGPEYRLLALFRFWAVINYFFPYKNLIGDSWGSVLARYIPKFEANKNAVDYQLTVCEMVTEIYDSHGRVENADASDEKLGIFVPPILVRYIENQAVITNVLDDKLPVKVGDVILTIDGEPTEKRREYLSRFDAASTPQSLMRSVHLLLPGGQKNSMANLQLRGIDGKVREANLVRSMSTNEQKSFSYGCRSTPVFQVLPNGYGYVDLARLAFGEVDTMFKTIKNTPAVIFDMRGYPKGTGWAISSRLTEKEMPIAALMSLPLLEAPSLGDPELAEHAYAFAQKLSERNGDLYKGKVVMLINEDAISQAEHTCLLFEAATDVTFIGTPTMGANGNVTYMVLPGNLPVRFTGLNVRHADGRQLQRVGIQPNILVAPTIKGIAGGRDEILEAAVKYLRKTYRK